MLVLELDWKPSSISELSALVLAHIGVWLRVPNIRHEDDFLPVLNRKSAINRERYSGDEARARGA